VISTSSLPGRRPDARYLGRDFRHFQHSEPEVVALAGEFNWRVRLGDRCVVDDYVAPPLILSSERTPTELTWSLGEYVEPADLWKAFGLRTTPPPRIGVAPNQPSPHKGRTFAYWAVFIATVCVALVMQFGFMLLQSGAGKATVAFSAVAGSPQRTVSGVLDLGSLLATPAVVHIATDASLAWVDLDLQLVDVATGRAWRLARQLGYRAAGSAGSLEDVATIAALPGGRYTLTIDARAGAGRDPRTGRTQAAVTGQVRLYRSSLGWSSFWLLAGFLFLWPLVATLRAAAFEARRWAESDYPPQSSGDEDDEDDDE
jgi:hypothetical protein